MSYKYYSVMRPVDIGTFPGKPESIHNYDSRQAVETADGATIMAWGELQYSEPLTERDVRQYELRGEYLYAPYKHVGYWMNDGNHEIIKLNGRFYALSGWNGEEYGHCWECQTKAKAKDDKEYTLRPVYRYDTDSGQLEMQKMADLEEGSDEWDKLSDYLNEIISYSVTEN